MSESFLLAWATVKAHECAREHERLNRELDEQFRKTGDFNTFRARRALNLLALKVKLDFCVSRAYGGEYAPLSTIPRSAIVCPVSGVRNQ